MNKSVELKRERFGCEIYNQWKDLFGDCNWTDFTVIHLGGEYAPYMGSVELSLGLMGFTVTLTYRYDFGPLDGVISLKDEIINDLKAEHPDIEIMDPLGVLDSLERD